MLFVYDKLILTENTIIKFVFDVSSSVASKELDVKISIAWTDIPTITDISTTKSLVNDIDLLVVTPSNKAYWGNRVPDGDAKNPIEQVELVAWEAGKYSIYLHARTFPTTSTQNVSLAMVYPNGLSVTGNVSFRNPNTQPYNTIL